MDTCSECSRSVKWEQPARPEGAGKGFSGEVMFEIVWLFPDGGDGEGHHGKE